VSHIEGLSHFAEPGVRPRRRARFHLPARATSRTVPPSSVRISLGALAIYIYIYDIISHGLLKHYRRPVHGTRHAVSRHEGHFARPHACKSGVERPIGGSPTTAGLSSGPGRSVLLQIFTVLFPRKRPL
jgi:hypothetical protein